MSIIIVLLRSGERLRIRLLYTDVRCDRQGPERFERNERAEHTFMAVKSTLKQYYYTLPSATNWTAN